jgi:hypothetical protein
MKYMNDYDLTSALTRYDQRVVPNRFRLAVIVAVLADETNRVSDGWAYWSVPCRAAAKAIGLIESTAHPEHARRQREDITDAEFAAAVRPIRAMLTRHREVFSDDQRDRILYASTGLN